MKWGLRKAPQADRTIRTKAQPWEAQRPRAEGKEDPDSLEQLSQRDKPSATGQSQGNALPWSWEPWVTLPVGTKPPG